MTEPTGNSGVIAPPPLLYLVALIITFVLHWWWTAPILGHATWAVSFGIVLGVLGLALGLWGRSKMIAAGTNINPLKPTTSIVTGGPFSFTRNPLYVGMMLLYLGLTIGFDTWWGIALLVPLAVIMHVGVIRREERYLEGKFGDDYRQYKSAVARYVG
ncbi:MAG: isoprenylcysteine carboxylmethyltransferase family protein [Alphaproteobacteria bacterium]|nr:isoprenylcysteine carboxylmethyltransferase family protein [Alphaproteobacteria bacterium]